MILDFYKLSEQPFGVTPDPRYLYLGAAHREALASLLYGVKAGRGFTALIAKPGLGKTTLLFELLRKAQNSARTGFIFQPQTTAHDLLRNILSDLEIEADRTDLAGMQAKLNEVLIQEARRGKQVIVVIDEAQSLEEPLLEVLRMLSNFETARQKLMQIILAGQPQLAEKLASANLSQLRQRVSMIARLTPFNAEDTKAYIGRRLRVAGYDFEQPLFTNRALGMICSITEGVPRNINNVCFHAMSLGFVLKQRTIDRDVIDEVMKDLDLEPLFRNDGRPVTWRPLEPREQAGSSATRTGAPLHRWIRRLALSSAALAGGGGLALLANSQAPKRLNWHFSPVSRRFLASEASTQAGATGDQTGSADPGMKHAEGFGAEPWLDDPDTIQAGQKVVVPSSKEGARSIPGEVQQVPDSRGNQTEKP